MPPRKSYFDSELLARIGRLELTARRIVDGFLAGKNRSSRHGFSVEFVEHREYTPGDDLRHLDWKVLGRMDRYYIKRYEEETNITAFLFVDASASMTYGGPPRAGAPDGSARLTKFETAASVASALGYLLNRQRDAVGLALHDDELRVHQPPSVRLASLANAVTQLHEHIPQGKTSFDETLKRVVLELPRRCLFVMLSDFFVPIDEIDAALKFLYYRGHEAIVLQVLDPAERNFPFDSNMLFRGLEDARELVTEPHRLRKRYLEILETFIGEVQRVAQSCGFDYQLLDSPADLGATLAALLARRLRVQRPIKRGKSG